MNSKSRGLIEIAIAQAMAGRRADLSVLMSTERDACLPAVVDVCAEAGIFVRVTPRDWSVRVGPSGRGEIRVVWRPPTTPARVRIVEALRALVTGARG
jgi:hypothetical protein